MKQSLLLIVFICITTLGFAQSVIGEWTTIESQTGKNKYTVQLYVLRGKLYGKITYLYPKEGRELNPVCKKCTDDRKDKPLVGLQIVRDLNWDGKEFKGGTILDPGNGKVYEVVIWFDPEDRNKLFVRGYSGTFYKTQTWLRAK